MVNAALSARRVAHESDERATMATVLCVLYDDPIAGYPPAYARDGIPTI